jgi:hypothetical protein
MDTRPPAPTLTRDEHGVRIGGHRPVDFDRARGLVSELLRLSEHPIEGRVYTQPTGSLPLEAALSLAVRLAGELAERIREGHVKNGLLPEPDPEQPANGEGAPLAHLPELGGEG